MKLEVYAAEEPINLEEMIKSFLNDDTITLTTMKEDAPCVRTIKVTSLDRLGIWIVIRGLDYSSKVPGPCRLIFENGRTIGPYQYT